MDNVYLTFKQISIGFFKKVYNRRYTYLSDVIFHYYLILHPLDDKIKEEIDIVLDYVIILWLVNKLYFDYCVKLNDILWLYKTITGEIIDKNKLLEREMKIHSILCDHMTYNVLREFYNLVK